MKTLYAVEWIEVEYGWGSRPEGFKLFDNLDECIKSTKESSEKGNYEYGGGYFGPKRPLEYHILEDSDIKGPFPKFIDKINIKQNTVEII